MKKVYVVLCNSDMTEGNGPMRVMKIFEHRENALKYMNAQKGVMGRSAFYTNSVTGHVSEGWHDIKAWPWGGDWEVQEWILDEYNN